MKTLIGHITSSLRAILIAASVALLGFGAYKIYDQYSYTPYAQAIYNRYYTHFYDSYSQTLQAHEADYYAKYYATYYADYYNSPAYREALKYALPEATKEAFEYQASVPTASLGINQMGIELIKGFEGFRAEPYADVGGKLTIGYGHLIRPGEYYTSITPAQGEALLRQDIKLAEAVIKRAVKVQLTPNQFSALTSLVYNIGSHHFETSTLLKKLNQQQFPGAAQELLRWDHVAKRKVRGLTRRRKAEKTLFEQAA